MIAEPKTQSPGPRTQVWKGLKTHEQKPRPKN